MVSTPSGSSPLKGSSRTSNSGSIDEGRGQLHPLLVAMRELVERIAGTLAEPKRFEEQNWPPLAAAAAVIP